jgi:hypothetical protein
MRSDGLASCIFMAVIFIPHAQHHWPDSSTCEDFSNHRTVLPLQFCDHTLRILTSQEHLQAIQIAQSMFMQHPYHRERQEWPILRHLSNRIPYNRDVSVCPLPYKTSSLPELLIGVPRIVTHQCEHRGSLAPTPSPTCSPRSIDCGPASCETNTPASCPSRSEHGRIPQHVGDNEEAHVRAADVDLVEVGDAAVAGGDRDVF